ncbi:Uncharacterised protein [Veillonella criceti]|uniref:Uncharacterized protein n=1 Tax=Veillonella criceti TaxID=103891 RepID=A0A380NMX1_9FIRM|nr:Uncharacterised protein [Veillonella criceti]
MEKPIQYLHVSLWDFYKKIRRGADTTQLRIEALHKRINNRVPFIGVSNLYTADDMLNAYNTGYVDSLAIGKSVMLNPNLVQLIESGRESEIETTFDWDKAEKYRYTNAMLDGTCRGIDFIQNQNNLNYAIKAKIIKKLN